MRLRLRCFPHFNIEQVSKTNLKRTKYTNGRLKKSAKLVLTSIMLSPVIFEKIFFEMGPQANLGFPNRPIIFMMMCGQKIMQSYAI